MALEQRTRTRRADVVPDWDLVLKRNPVERLKKEKAPLSIRDELPALIAAGYEQVAEEDVVRSYDLSAASYITKPVTFERLVEVIRALGKYWLEIVELPPDERST